ncbi:ABC transporter permease [Agromyces bauzanensis]|uniref:ABC3 transporter permease C-terminal domain-containing protein n=1 Tax=Agromyces bauzanensis TaxID=1308924 RepID=A0A917PRV4_9MICO|nr:ABC transporter permease [Agromyces bauzanensis]GGJ89092.1 hypothetical protein GCM10011372_29630 [Agromyces bauzanensis]
MSPARTARVAGFLALRSITRGNAGVTAMAIAMMAVVFVSVSFLPALIGGATASIDRQLRNTLTGDLTITAAEGVAITAVDAYLAELRAVPGVQAATSARRVGTQIAFGDESNAWGVDAIDPVSFGSVFSTAQALVEGEFLSPGDIDGIVLGIDIAGADREELRAYASSLKSVHVGDRVDVTMIGGAVETFVVRGIYQNSFALSDQAAYISTAAADARVPTADFGMQVEEMYAATDEIAAGVEEARGQAASLSSGADALAEGIAGLKQGADELANGVSQVADGAAELADAATELAAGAVALAAATEGLATTLSTLAADAAGSAVAAAGAAASGTQLAAAEAASLAAACPVESDPEFCTDLAAHAAAVQLEAEQAAASEALVTATATGVSAAATAAEELAARAGALAGSVAELAANAATLTDGAQAIESSAHSLAAAAGESHSAALRVADGAAGIAEGLAASAENVPASGEGEREALTEALSAGASAPGADTATRITVIGEPGVSTAELTAAIAPLRDDVEFQSPEQLAAAIQDQLDTFELVDGIMRLISLLVAAITVFIITYVDLTNRRRQIGIERAIGIRANAIVGSYMLKSMITATLGVVTGAALFAVVIVPLVERFPFVFPNGPVTLVADVGSFVRTAGILLVVAAVSAVIPAVQTVRMKILDAIWGA